MDSRSTVISLHGVDFVLGHGGEWLGRPVKADKAHDVWVVRHRKARGRYLVARKGKTRRLHSLAALLASLAPSGFYLFELGPRSAWILHVLDGKVSSDSDRIYVIDSEAARGQVTDILYDHQQIVQPDQVHHLRSVEEMEALLSTHGLKADDKRVKAARLKAQRTEGLATLIGLAAVAGGLFGAYELYDGYSSKQRAKESAARYAQQMIQQNEMELAGIAATIPAEHARAYLKSALSLPFHKSGYEMQSVNCELQSCQTEYKNANARVTSAAYKWAKGIDPNAVLDMGVKTITFSYSVEVTTDNTIPMRTLEETQLAWADLITMAADTEAKFDLAEMLLLPGSEETGRIIMRGDWAVAGVPMAYGLAVIDGLKTIPGLRFSRVAVSNGQINFGGIYAIEISQ